MPTGQPSFVMNRVSIFALFNFDQLTYDRISALAYYEQQGICQTMQHLIEFAIDSYKRDGFDSDEIIESFKDVRL